MGNNKRIRVPEVARGKNSTLVNGQELKWLRLQVGWTQEMAAVKSGYSARLIRKLESGGPVAWQTLRDVLGAYCEPLERPLNVQAFVASSTGRSKQMARDWLDAVFKYRDLDLADRFVAVDVALVSDGQIQNGPIAMRRQWSQILAAFDPIEYHVEEIVSSSDAIAAFWSWRGKHVAKYGELPATCQWATGKGCTLMRRCGDQIAVIREHHDIAPVLRARQDCTD